MEQRSKSLYIIIALFTANLHFLPSFTSPLPLSSTSPIKVFEDGRRSSLFFFTSFWKNKITVSHVFSHFLPCVCVFKCKVQCLESLLSINLLLWDSLLFLELVLKGLVLSLYLSHAKQALLSGCSAGGLASILKCDEFRELFSSSTKVKCLSDGGLFLDA